MPTFLFVPDRQCALDATRLIDEYGTGAVTIALGHADSSRDRGNVVKFCRWRQIARLIDALQNCPGAQTRH